jgi:hypothetical protein
MRYTNTREDCVFFLYRFVRVWGIIKEGSDAQSRFWRFAAALGRISLLPVLQDSYVHPQGIKEPHGRRINTLTARTGSFFIFYR